MLGSKCWAEQLPCPYSRSLQLQVSLENIFLTEKNISYMQVFGLELEGQLKTVFLIYKKNKILIAFMTMFIVLQNCTKN